MIVRYFLSQFAFFDFFGDLALCGFCVQPVMGTQPGAPTETLPIQIIWWNRRSRRTSTCFWGTHLTFRNNKDECGRKCMQIIELHGILLPPTKKFGEEGQTSHLRAIYSTPPSTGTKHANLSSLQNRPCPRTFRPCPAQRPVSRRWYIALYSSRGVDPSKVCMFRVGVNFECNFASFSPPKGTEKIPPFQRSVSPPFSLLNFARNPLHSTDRSTRWLPQWA